MDEKYGPSIVASHFLNWFYAALIVLLICVKGSEANGRLLASERGFVIQVREECRRRGRVAIAVAVTAAAVTAAAAAAVLLMLLMLLMLLLLLLRLSLPYEGEAISAAP